VEKNRSLDSTISSFGTITNVREARRPSQTLELAGPVFASRGQIDLSTNPSGTDIHIMFDHTPETVGAGISPGGGKDSDSIEDHAIS
jgi:hypothetical protein